jgi:hypothetical protein
LARSAARRQSDARMIIDGVKTCAGAWQELVPESIQCVFAVVVFLSD